MANAIRNGMGLGWRCLNVTKRWYAGSTNVETMKRAILYVPAHDDRKVNKAASELDADVVCLDCEDAVVDGRKEEARKKAALFLNEMDFGRSEVAVRLNAVSTGLCGQDIREIMSSEVLPDAIVLPKVESEEDILYFVDRMVSVLKLRIGKEGDTRGKRGSKLQLLPKCESAKGLLRFGNILEKAKEYRHLFEVSACLFGGYDFATSIHAIRSKGSEELVFARQCFVSHCRAQGILPIDMIYTDFKDEEGLFEESLQARRFGFAGKQVIHPSSIEPVQKAFLPSEEEIQEAKELVELFEKMDTEGVGAFLHRGAMVDLPMLKRARGILRLSEHAFRTPSIQTNKERDEP